ncbi:MAG: MarR family transcriptional regulator, transcriptional regulator for hemolysin [Solirubrobacteraceae bacterium]|jgi:MarR family transcriptional regulator for hemolysin|nr:MarR family transcriptional regulator, transcriptional regulator for hemolysin [Solirubrobacteraceae bacterium]
MTVMPRPPRATPLGLRLTRTARVASQEFERAMAEAGGSAPAWQVLLLVRSGQLDTQARIAQAMGVTQATLTHHLNALEAQGLVRRWRDQSNRRVQRTELTDEGEAMFDRLRKVARRHDERLRSILSAEEAGQLEGLLEKLESGLGEPVEQVKPRAPAARTRLSGS